MATTARFRFREHWRELRRGRPGRRFQARYEHARQAEQGGAVERVMLFSVAVVCVVIGLALSVFPGPAFPFFILAGGLLATESRGIAKFMDWAEVRLRTVFAWGLRHWRRLPRFGKVALVLVGVACSAAVAYVAIRWVSD